MRWRIDAAGDVHLADRSNIGPLDDAIRTVFGVNQPQIRAQVIGFLGWQAGVDMNVCTAFGFAARDHWAEFMAQNGGVWEIVDRATADARWSDEFDAGGSAELVGIEWETQGRSRYWCVTFGPTEGHCCHREDQATNDARRADLSATSVSVRSKAQGAS